MSTDASPSEPIAVLGAGSWGTALALLLARNGRRVLLWGHDPQHLAEIDRHRCNVRYLPNHTLPAGISTEPDLAQLAEQSRAFLVAVPSAGFRPLLSSLAPYVDPGALFAQATKGMEPGGGRRLSELAYDILGVKARWSVVAGPTFAREVADGLPTALTVAARDLADASLVAAWLRHGRVRVYTTADVTGVEVGGAVKNVLAIAAGISDGLGFGANARAALMTRGLAEMTRLGIALGGLPSTFIGLSGLGDLVLTCTDNLSRNRQIGLAIGRGQTLDASLQSIGQVAEGVLAAAEVRALAGRMGVEMPIVEQVYRVLHEGRPAVEAVEQLLRREPRSEGAG